MRELGLALKGALMTIGGAILLILSCVVIWAVVQLAMFAIQLVLLLIVGFFGS